MSEIGTSEGASVEAEKPVVEEIKFPPFPDPSDKDFDEDLSNEEKAYYKKKFPDINEVVNVRLHCTACDRHLGCSARNENRMRSHPMLRTLICHTCHSFYNSGEFDKGEDGSELYCRWCGQGGQVYCCSDCIHVFCAKCIKRNFGVAKIKEIENTDDWKCFKCNPRCLWDLRAVCWALLRFCDIRNKIVFHTEDPQLKEKYQKAVATDLSECCRSKGRRKEKTDSAKKKDKEAEIKNTITKLPPTIQVKKFASISLDDTPKIEKKSLKRPASPKPKISPGFIQKPISIAPCPIPTPPLIKKVRLPNAPMLNHMRFGNEKKICNTYTRMPNRPRQPFPIPIVNTPFNGISNPYSMNMPSLMGDNINLSLETLTQGLDMAAVAAFNNTASNIQPSNENDVVCTPDFPMEPLCEVAEDNDDDVECITPGPVVPPPKVNNPPPLVPRSLPDLSSDNIVQMTENDVTVNTLTGGLKFRVDPQTLSSKKMYRLPDGRIFAINLNPSMPGGYSATIVSVSDAGGKVGPKSGETYAAKLSAIASSPTPSGSNSKPRNNSNTRKSRKSVQRSKAQKSKQTSKENRECDLKVPVEWYRYNLIDAVDALDYSLSRLNKLKKEATTTHLRTRTVDEIKYLHRTLEQLLTTSSKRFLEIRDSLNKELKQYISRKLQSNSGDMTEEDDDVEFLPNAGNDDPIFIDENSVDSVSNNNHEVDLTGAASNSEHNDSTENKNESDPLICNEDFTTINKNANSSTVELNDSSARPHTLLSKMLSENNGKDETTNSKEDADMADKQDVNLNDMEGAGLHDKQIDEPVDKQNTKLDDIQDFKLDDKQNVKLDVKQDTKLNDEQIEKSNDKLVEKSNNEPVEKSNDNPVEKSNDMLITESDEEQDVNPKNELDGSHDTKIDEKSDVELMTGHATVVKEENDKNSDNDDSCKLNSELMSNQKIGEINEKAKHNVVQSMNVDSNKQSVCDKAETDDEQTQDTDISEEMVERLLKDTDSFDGINNVSNTSHLDVLEELRDEP